VLLAAEAAAAPPAPPPPQAVAVQEAFRQVVAGAKPAVVSIDSVFKRSETETPFLFGAPDDFTHRFFGGEEEDPHARRKQRLRRVTGIGSGVITAPGGYVLTNEHVVGGAEEIRVVVKNPEEKTYKGKIVGTDPASDLAVIKIEPRDGPFPYAALGDSDKVQPGDWAIAVGSPFGLEQTVTIGVISALRQSVKVEDRDYSDFFQTDAAINQGNSGGPLLDVSGRVIGINTAIFSPTGVFGGVGFAIPSNQAARIMKELISKGRVTRGWAGVEIAPLDDVLAKQFKLPDQGGALINSVLPDSPAAKAGLKRGDVIVEFGGRKVASPNAFIKLVEQTPPGKKVPVKLIRARRAQELELSIGERPPKTEETGQNAPSKAGGAGAAARWQGARLQTAGDDLKDRFRLPRDAAGAVVTEVDEDSPAAEMGLRPGDLVLSINGRRVQNAPAFAAAASGVSIDAGVVLDVNRRGEPLYLSWRQAR
jgi:serine protease Do